MTASSFSTELIYGSMRMELTSNRDEGYWLAFLRNIHLEGIHTIHLSSEYPNYSIVLPLLAKLRKDGFKFKYVVKLAEPHFGSTEFNPALFLEKLSSYCDVLDVSHIETVQWLWRDDLAQENRRIDGLLRQQNDLDKTFSSLKRSGMIGQIICFPYTETFGLGVLAQSWCDGLAVYLNPLEKESLRLCIEAERLGKTILAIRPYAASSAINAGHSPEGCMAWVRRQPAVKGIVLTFSSLDHYPSGI